MAYKDKKEKKDLLVYYTTRLAVKVQGCSSCGCDFNTNNVGTADICRCAEEAKNLMKMIDSILNTKVD